MTTVTVHTGLERRRRWSSAEKVRIVEESLAPGAISAVVARRHDVHPNLLQLWRRQARTGVLSLAAEGGRHFVPVALVSLLKNRVGLELGFPMTIATDDSRLFE